MNEKEPMLSRIISNYGGDDLLEVDQQYFNPFVYKGPTSRYEKIKMIVMCIFLVPLIRMVLIMALLVPLVLLSVIGTIGHVSIDPITGKDVPLSPIRRFILYPTRWIYRLILFVLGFYWISVTYPKEPQPQAKLIVANHVSFIDGMFFVAHCFPSVAMKAELASVPILGNLVRALDPILIDRKTQSGRQEALARIHDRPASGKFPDLLIFPEGTTSCQSNLTKFKRGPFTPGLPVQPVVLRYPFSHFDLSWTPSLTTSYLFFRLLCQVYQQMHVEYLPVYVPSEAESNNAELFAENVRQSMAKHMNVPCTNHAFEDVMLLMEVGDYAGSHVLPQTNIEEVRAITSMKCNEVQRLVRHFAANDTNQDGKISFLEMKAILRHEDSNFIQRLFNLMDADGNGQIDFRELCLGLSVLSPEFNRNDRIHFAFSLYDIEENGYISTCDLRNVLQLARRLSGLSYAAVDKFLETFELDTKISYEEFHAMVDKRPELLDMVFEKMKPLSSRLSGGTQIAFNWHETRLLSLYFNPNTPTNHCNWTDPTTSMAPYFTETDWKAPEFSYFEATIVFLTFVYLLETYLDYRQHQMLKVKVFPKRLEKSLAKLDKQSKKEALLPKTKEKFDKSRAYGLDKSTFGFISSFYSQLESTAFLYLGYFPFVWTLSGSILTYFNQDVSNEILRAVVFTFLTSVRDLVFQLPFGLYSTFVIEERHGFNKQTVGLFFMDKLKGLLIMAVISLPVQSALIYIIQWGGEYFYLYVWGFLCVFSIIMVTLYPVLIMPLFNKFTPLEEGALRTKIEALAKSLAFPLTKLFVCDGSKRSSHSNAYFFGFFKSKRIVLFDTLLTQATDEEIVAILGHELGHWSLWHTMQGFFIQQLYVFAAFFMYGTCMNDGDLYASFGFNPTTKPVLIGLTLYFTTVWAPVDKILSFLVTAHTRRNEFQADAFAVQLGHGEPLQSGLTKISIENLSNMNPDPLYSAYHYSHPPLVERLAAVDLLMKKTN